VEKKQAGTHYDEEEPKGWGNAIGDRSQKIGSPVRVPVTESCLEQWAKASDNCFKAE